LGKWGRIAEVGGGGGELRVEEVGGIARGGGLERELYERREERRLHQFSSRGVEPIQSEVALQVQGATTRTSTFFLIFFHPPTVPKVPRRQFSRSIADRREPADINISNPCSDFHEKREGINSRRNHTNFPLLVGSPRTSFPCLDLFW